MQPNIIDVTFGGKDSLWLTGRLYQWDTGQIIRFGDQYPDGTEVQFGRRYNDGQTVNRIIESGCVPIPDACLQSPDNLICWVVVIGADYQTTIKRLQLEVKARNKPGDYIADEDEQTFREWVQQQVNSAVAATSESASAAAKSEEQSKLYAQAAGVSASAAAQSQQAAGNSAEDASASARAAASSAAQSEQSRQEAAAEADRALNNILNGVSTHNAEESAHPHLLEEISRVETIARGRNFGEVFDTKAEMEAWLSDPDNIATLGTGTNLYIRELNTPDYWWDGSTYCQLEVEHPDLSGYATKVQLSASLPLVLEQSEYDALIESGTLSADRIYYVVPDGTLGGADDAG